MDTHSSEQYPGPRTENLFEEQLLDFASQSPKNRKTARKLLPHWDSVLLGVIFLAIVALCAYQMFPPPRAVLTLQPLTTEQELAFARSSLAVSGEALEGNSSEITEDLLAKPISHGRQPRKSAWKKPKKPPVVNLNTATSSQLELLPGIGPAMAQRIIEYRQTHGAFQTVEQVTDVSGIGPKKLEKIRPFLKL